MIVTAAFELFADIFTGESSDTITKLSIGYGTTAEALTDTGLDDAYTDHGFEQATVTGSYASGVLTFTNTFTNNHTANRTITELGLFSAAGALIYRRLFNAVELPNFGIIPPGKSITIILKISISDASIITSLVGSYPSEIATAAYNIYIAFDNIASYVDLTTFECPDTICFNGIPLPNAGIKSFSEALGAKTWIFTCYTDDYSKVTALLKYAGPIQTGNSITGRQYVISSYRAGCLAIYNKTTHTHDTYINSYIKGPISPEPFGVGWWFGVEVLQSAYNEA